MLETSSIMSAACTPTLHSCRHHRQYSALRLPALLQSPQTGASACFATRPPVVARWVMQSLVT